MPRKLKPITFAEHMGFSSPIKKRSTKIKKEGTLLDYLKDKLKVITDPPPPPGGGGNKSGATLRPTYAVPTSIVPTASVQPTLAPTSTPLEGDVGDNPTTVPPPDPGTPVIQPTPFNSVIATQMAALHPDIPGNLRTPGIGPIKIDPTFVAANGSVLGPTLTAQASQTPTATPNMEATLQADPRYVNYMSQLGPMRTQEAIDRGTATPTATVNAGLVPPDVKTRYMANDLSTAVDKLMPWILNDSDITHSGGIGSPGKINPNEIMGFKTQVSALDPSNKASQFIAGGWGGTPTPDAEYQYGMNPDKAESMGSMALRARQLADDVFDTNKNIFDQAKRDQIYLIQNNTSNRNLLIDPDYQRAVQTQNSALNNMETARQARQLSDNYFIARGSNVKQSEFGGKSYIEYLQQMGQKAISDQATAIAVPTASNIPTATKTPTATSTRTSTRTPSPQKTSTPIGLPQGQATMTPKGLPQAQATAVALPSATAENKKTPKTGRYVGEPVFASQQEQAIAGNKAAYEASLRGYGGSAMAAAANASRIPAKVFSPNPVNPQADSSGIGQVLASLGNTISSWMTPPVAAAAAPKTGYSGAAVAAATQDKKSKEAAEWKRRTEEALRLQEQARANKLSTDKQQAADQAASSASSAGYNGAAAAAAGGAAGSGSGSGSGSGGSGGSGTGSSGSSGSGGSSSGGPNTTGGKSFNIINNPVTGLNLPDIKPKTVTSFASGAGLGSKFSRMPPNKKGKLKKDIGTGSGLTAHATQPVKESPMPKVVTRYGAYKFPSKNSSFNRSDKYGEKQTLNQPIRKQMTPTNSYQTNAMKNPPSQLPNVMQYPPSRAARYAPTIAAPIEGKIASNNPPYYSTAPVSMTFKKIMEVSDSHIDSQNVNKRYVPPYLRRKK